jgi:hypothetical protein
LNPFALVFDDALAGRNRAAREDAGAVYGRCFDDVEWRRCDGDIDSCIVCGWSV